MKIDHKLGMIINKPLDQICLNTIMSLGATENNNNKYVRWRNAIWEHSPKPSTASILLTQHTVPKPKENFKTI